MCSSPKSSGQTSPRASKIRGVFAELSSEKQARFTAIANAADERRQRRIQLKSSASDLILNHGQQAKSINITKLTNPSILNQVKRRLIDTYHWASQKDLIGLFH
ncbi:MAG: hypothetical protein Q9M92_14535 [Enterobacterales bacterium]|nr:hypothetical protein [Enterobacterales bacterium]